MIKIRYRSHVSVNAEATANPGWVSRLITLARLRRPPTRNLSDAVRTSPFCVASQSIKATGSHKRNSPYSFSADDVNHLRARDHFVDHATSPAMTRSKTNKVLPINPLF